MIRGLMLSGTIGALVLGGAGAACAIDYAWNIPANVRVVQKTTANARTFAKVQLAINDCVAKMGTTLKATNRCVVKVGPGTWPGAITMHSFVDVEGAGDDTILTSATALNTPIYSTTPLTAATVKMAANSELRNLKVRNTSATGGIAVLFDGVAARLTSVTAEVASACTVTPGEGCYNSAITSQGALASAVLRGVTARVAHGGAADDQGENPAVLSIRGGKIELENSVASVSGGGFQSAIACIDEGGGSGSNGSVEVRDVKAEIATNGYALHVLDATCVVSVRDSVLRTVACDPSASAVDAGPWGAPISISGSELIDCRCGVAGDLVKVSASLIDQRGAPCSYAGGTKIVGCWDQAFNPIPNQ